MRSYLSTAVPLHVLFEDERPRCLGLLVIYLLLTTATITAQGQVFISEYVEGSINNKAVEIYNGGASPIDLFSDGFKLIFYYDGASTPSRTIQLTGTVTPGDVYVLAHQNADPQILAVADHVDGGGFFDGDDAIQLINTAGVVDVIGQVGVDPGTEWGIGETSTRDNTLCRKPSILLGDANAADEFDPIAEWDGFAANTFTNLGAHTVGPLPVELTSFTGVIDQGDVLLRWAIESEVNNAGFEILHFTFGLPADRSVGFIPSEGSTDRFREYSFRVRAVDTGSHRYRLKQVDVDGSSSVIGTLVIEVPNMQVGLQAAYPNPFHRATRIVYSVPLAGQTRLGVYSLTGQEVVHLFSQWMESGVHELRFDSQGLASGIYLLRLEVSGHEYTRTIVLVD